MVLDLTALFTKRDGILDFDMSEPIEDIEIYGEAMRFLEPLHFTGKVAYQEGVFVVKGEAHTRYKALCGRCGRDVYEELSMQVEEEYSRDEDPDLPDRYPLTGDKVDFTEMLVQNVILALPVKHLCKEDCKGVCPICGKDLNEGDCACVKPELHEDTRFPFEALNALKMDDIKEE